MTEEGKEDKKLAKWREDLYEVIFGVDTWWGKTFDVVLLVCIFLSVLAVMLESVAHIEVLYGNYLYVAEWFFTILFTIEYIARLIVVRRPLKYALSFFGIIDLLSIVPTYVSLLVSGAHMLLVIRSIRLLRVFRVLKLVRFLGEAGQLAEALRASRAKITVFIGGVFILVVLLGSIMYLIEGGTHGFTSIPRSIYWAIVTLTTVGYGDIAPQTVLGQAIASCIMILGYGIIAVPTGIVTSEMTRTKSHKHDKVRCEKCGNRQNDKDAVYCKICGNTIDMLR